MTVASVPLLSTGKTDYASLQELADSRTAIGESEILREVGDTVLS
jgi:hypothetical protein